MTGKTAIIATLAMLTRRWTMASIATKVTLMTRLISCMLQTSKSRSRRGAKPATLPTKTTITETRGRTDSEGDISKMVVASATMLTIIMMITYKSSLAFKIVGLIEARKRVRVADLRVTDILTPQSHTALAVRITSVS